MIHFLPLASLSLINFFFYSMVLDLFVSRGVITGYFYIHLSNVLKRVSVDVRVLLLVYLICTWSKRVMYNAEVYLITL